MSIFQLPYMSLLNLKPEMDFIVKRCNILDASACQELRVKQGWSAHGNVNVRLTFTIIK